MATTPASDPVATESAPAMPRLAEWWALLRHRPGAAALGGMTAGLIVGGVGGRLAMSRF